MATSDLKEFIEDRLLAYDPDIDLSDGSPAQDQVVDPIVRRFQPDPFEMNVETFIETRLRQEMDLNTREGSGIRDLLVKPNQILLDPISREVQLLRQSQSLANPELLAPSEADALVANLFINRSRGGLATGTVRLYFNAPIAINISASNLVYTVDGRRYLPTTLQSISAEAMIFNQSGNLYYFDIQVTAEKPGAEYNISKSSVVGITNLNSAVRVDNPDKFENGLDEETTDDLVQRAELAVTERSLVVGRGAATRLRAQFEDLMHLQIVGMFDEEMERDVLTGGDLGPVLLSNNDGYTEDDGDGDDVTHTLKTYGADLYSLFDGPGVVSNYKLTVQSVSYGTDGEVQLLNLSHFHSATARFKPSDVGSVLIRVSSLDLSNVGVAKIIGYSSPTEVVLSVAGGADTNITWILTRPTKEFDITEVMQNDELRFDGNLDVDLQSLIWSIRQRVLTLSDIPGGILFSADTGTIEILPDQVHIGGATDFYVRGTSVSEESLVVAAVADENPRIIGMKGETDSSAADTFFYDSTVDFVESGVLPGHSLVIDAGADAGSKRILRVGIDQTGAADPHYIQVGISDAFALTASEIRYRIVDSIDLDLRQPRTVRGTGADLQTIQLSKLVTTTSALDFTQIGTQVGDTLRIKDGVDASDYRIEAISGTGNKNLTLSSPLTATLDNLSWEVFKAQDGIQFPLVRIRSIDLLDSSRQLTGDTIPFADPIDARSYSFSNAGNGVKVQTIDAITGIVGGLNLDGLTYPLAATTISVKVNNASPLAIVLTGAVSKTDLLNKINAVVPNIAGVLDVDGEDRLTIRSGDRWLIVVADANNANIGLDINGEDNRQIKSAAEIVDWGDTDYGLLSVRDVVSITTGDNIGYHHLVAVKSSPTSKLLAVKIDELSGALRFLQPNVNVSLTVGSRSFGKARVYFLEPTSFEVRGNWHGALKNTTDVPANAALSETGTTIIEDENPLTYFSATIDGSTLRFIPDPELYYQVVPSPDEDTPNNLLTVAADNTLEVKSSSLAGVLGQNSRGTEIDFLLREVKVGDLIDVTYQPIQGSNDLTPGILSDFFNRTLILSLDGALPRTLTFSKVPSAATDLTDEINTFFGENIASIETIGSAKYLKLEADFSIVVHKNGSANGGPGNHFGLSVISNTSNKAVDNIDGFYTVTSLEPLPFAETDYNKIEVSPAPTTGGQAQHFKVLRPGVQRIHSTAMSDNKEFGLYYVDVELVSEGSGNQWNLAADQIFFVAGHESDGYRLNVVDSNLSFTIEENVSIELSRRILTVGSSDRPDQAVQLSGQNIQINYDRSPLVSSVQSFASSTLDRVLNASILVRHLFPHYINFSMNYRGGSSADVVSKDVLDHLNSLTPDDRVESSDIQDLARRRGADYIENPLTLVAVAHDKDRVISVDRSVNYVTKGRLSTFFVGEVSVTRESVEVL